MGSATRDQKLKKERDNTAWSPRALRINGWRYSGMLDADLVTRAICSGFTKQPKECKDLIAPRNPFMNYFEQPQVVQNGVSFGTLVGWLLGFLGIGFFTMILYKRYLKKEMRTT